MANKTTSTKNKPARKTLRPNEYYNPKTKPCHSFLIKPKETLAKICTPERQTPFSKFHCQYAFSPPQKVHSTFRDGQ